MFDSIVFDVWEGRVKEFKAFVRKQYGLRITSVSKDGGYRKVTVTNDYGFELWASLKMFYDNNIKI